MLFSCAKNQQLGKSVFGNIKLIKENSNKERERREEKKIVEIMITEKTEINESERREEMTKDRQSANENKGGNGMGEEKENVK